MRTTLELLATVGYDRMTVDAIAAGASVSKPTIYRRWPHGKGEIVLDAIRSRRSEESEMPNTGSLRGDLLAAVAATTGKLLADIHLAGGIITQLRESEELWTLVHDELTEHERRRFLLPVERAIARGELQAGVAIPDTFADIAPALAFTRVTITRDPVDEAFAVELVEKVLLPILGVS